VKDFLSAYVETMGRIYALAYKGNEADDAYMLPLERRDVAKKAVEEFIALLNIGRPAVE
jgi:hypothetical protein